ncbi:putative methyltransferase C9orf114 [Ischnura elegans]|uniref:putative methyltransferase C9orf114 n=1 Tax=Ischnura elegans TaxID=197161 RepID=UPI001ED8A6CC|nr:putative methyltransferase C9orf114 [Ischnura elegans]
MNDEKEIKSARERKLAKKKWKEEKLMKSLSKSLNESNDVETGPALKKIKSEGSSDVGPDSYKRRSTLSIAVPGSILDNAQSPELRTYLAGQIARAACIFQVDEVVVYDDLGEEESSHSDNEPQNEARPCCLQLARILQYLECPQYLRKHLFPLHKDLQFAGILNPLDAPHHFRQKDKTIYREGIVARRPVKPGRGSMVNVGLEKDVQINQVLQPGTRVTVKLNCDEYEDETSTGHSHKLRGEVVPPWQPRAHLDQYWGYHVRIANSMSAALSDCPFQGMYDLIIGTSDKGSKDIPAQLPSSDHILILFGGLQGLEMAVENNGGQLYKSVANDMTNLCDYYLNTCPKQGSRTIRTEEAILISLSVLTPKVVFKSGSFTLGASSES